MEVCGMQGKLEEVEELQVDCASEYSFSSVEAC
jgi:hypothetical protein